MFRSPATTAAVLALALGLLAAAPAAATTITEFPLPQLRSGPLGIAAGPDGALWFTESRRSRIGRITGAGRITEYSAAAGVRARSAPSGIAAAPDGALWFAQSAGDRIGRITTRGTATDQPAGITPGAGPQGIALGPDGNLWFTEAAGRIGRITPAGVVTEFSAGITPGSRPSGIAVGPDGAMWFTEEGGDRIGRITLDGVVTEFSAGITPGSGPAGIAAGPDGNLWFTERGGHRIGRITPGGLVTEFSEGIRARSEPLGIVAGPDGNLWFTERRGRGRIGRITPAGVVTEFSAGIRDGAGPAGITVSRDGDIWFTEFTGDRIGRVRLSPSVATGEAGSIGVDAAVLAGTVLPYSSRTHYAFQYGITTAYGSATPAQIKAPGRAPTTVTAPASGLAPGTVYHYRIVATSVAGVSFGEDRTFTTGGTPGTGGVGTPPAPVADRSGPGMRVAGGTLRLSGGRARVTLGCPDSEPLGCRGRADLEASAPGGAVLGGVRFSLPAGRTVRLAVPLSATGRAVVRRQGTVRVRVVVVAADDLGNERRTVARATLRAGA